MDKPPKGQAQESVPEMALLAIPYAEMALLCRDGTLGFPGCRNDTIGLIYAGMALLGLLYAGMALLGLLYAGMALLGLLYAGMARGWHSCDFCYAQMTKSLFLCMDGSLLSLVLPRKGLCTGTLLP